MPDLFVKIVNGWPLVMSLSSRTKQIESIKANIMKLYRTWGEFFHLQILSSKRLNVITDKTELHLFNNKTLVEFKSRARLFFIHYHFHLQSGG